MALWGGRFSENAAKSVQDFTESISFDKRLYRHDIMGSKAHAAMLGATGIIPKKSAEEIIEYLDKVREMIEEGKMKYDVALEDIHMHIETELIRLLGDEGARVHSARSRNDQVALDTRLYLRDKPLRRRGTVGLVGRKYLMSEMPAVPVHDKDEVFGPLLSEKLEQHPAHDVQRARGEAVGTRHSGIGEISPEQKGVAVHHIKGGPV